MVFSSTLFLFLFLPVFLVLYFCINKLAWKNIVLLIASLIFYAWGEPVYILLMLISILVNYYFAICIGQAKSGQDAGWHGQETRQDRQDTGQAAVTGRSMRQAAKKAKRKSQYWLTAAIVFNLALLGVFKYAGFVAANVNMLAGLPAPSWHVPLPIGISFYTFQILSYVIDVYRSQVQVQRNILYLGAYVAAFPQLIAGPIVRYETIEYELHERRITAEDFAWGIRRFMVGLAKKVLIANNTAFVADTILARAPEEYGLIGGWTAIICYTLQIYFDFSGYSDMAIGLGRMLGFRYLENFNYPYIARSVTDFWRRWHMSLSSFFRDYVYIPLGGNRTSKARFIFNILAVWSLTGLWHGSSWNFVLWGAYYGVLLLAEKMIFARILNKIPALFGHIYALLAVMIGWAVFRMESMAGITGLLGALFGLHGMSSITFLEGVSVWQGKYILAALIGCVASMPVVPALRKQLAKRKTAVMAVMAADLMLIALFLLSVVSLVSGGFNPFIYFRF